MEENFDVDKFISLIKTKESIWNYKSQTYGNKLQRKEDWDSICEAMVEDYRTKSSGEKNATAIELQNKWKVLRDGFTRSIKNYRKKCSKHGTTGKLYTYYTQLQFLNDLYADKGVVGVSGESSKREKEEKCRKRSKKKISETSSEDNESIQTEKPIIENDFDEDRQFLLSLLSDFRKIHGDQKLDAKGDIINVIRHYRNTAGNVFQARDSYYSSDIAALAITATEPANSPTSNYYEHTEILCDNSPKEIKFITT